MNTNSPEQNKKIVLQAFDTLFNKRDYKAAERFWSPDYIQHSAHIPPGREGLFNLVRAAPPALRYQNSLIFAQGDYLMLHGRFSGNGRPHAWIAADILRMQDGLLAEHWDVLQDEATKVDSQSGRPMFGDSFPVSDQQSVAPPLSVEQARTIVAPLYDALNQPAKKDVAALLAKAAAPDYRSYSTNEDWLTRDQLAEVFETLGAAVPDLRWTIKDVLAVGDQIVVRGEMTGTPTGELFGTRPTGKGFRSMSIDLFTVKSGKLSSAYHVENWVRAMQQISK
ncbi:MAG TPA: ester cyclase [Steroidobacteraceae bacterium]|jgi:predicted SnoaL-like aldol condensation-catalyzing enzyme/predicted ester cyclase|nr:ester cyclase [Steroidobacteraceae bacterium]